ncbi:uncharacterized protein K452DRAFT_301855 [Aplosporella prunicola CBS 121167]|uniref:PLAC8-domain-containing protein n=1 Tax=Aplosporella prunicola CBS 121167 TaxID=1176127 RepID=A0A6A6AZT0_9PEZI|nr:uncharacterized protein K452DRAFT_301855 [Aplosporella prunicola CBS 121167]KAF2137452.1 hypothetical protein K452DRAFT_301855 [Aplosporella prunicola CBS 121167]
MDSPSRRYYDQHHYQDQDHHQHQSSHHHHPQRFSWQLPFTDQERQPLHHVDPAPVSPDPRYALQQASSVPHPPPTMMAPDARYSIMQTPIEMQQPTFPPPPVRHHTEPITTHHQSPVWPSDSRSPASTEFGDMSAITPTAPLPLEPYFPLEKEMGIGPGEHPAAGGSSHAQLPEEYKRAPPPEPHPALFAPIDPVPTAHLARASMSLPQTPVQSLHRNSQRYSYASGQGPMTPPRSQSQPGMLTPPPQVTPRRHSQQLQPPGSPGPVPLKTESDNEAKYHQPMPNAPGSPAQIPYYDPPPTAPQQSRPIFSPDAAAGPNGQLTHSHQPGQIAHPNMDLSGSSGSKHEWKHSLCEPCSGDVGTCLSGVFCPCVVYGKTSYRLNLKSEKKDPTDLLGWSIFPLIHRTRLRHAYGLQGSLFSDIAKSCCCCCCSVVQNEREMRDREESARRWAGPGSGGAYEREGGMVYAAPPRG